MNNERTTTNDDERRTTNERKNDDDDDDDDDTVNRYSYFRMLSHALLRTVTCIYNHYYTYSHASSACSSPFLYRLFPFQDTIITRLPPRVISCNGNKCHQASNA